ncbi:hypothetical protein M514_00915, partial [Trichuris suis]
MKEYGLEGYENQQWHSAMLPPAVAMATAHSARRATTTVLLLPGNFGKRDSSHCSRDTFGIEHSSILEPLVKIFASHLGRGLITKSGEQLPTMLHFLFVPVVPGNVACRNTTFAFHGHSGSLIQNVLKRSFKPSTKQNSYSNGQPSTCHRSA